jgi:serine/threonine protein kinase
VLYEIATGRRLYSSLLHARLVDEILNRPASPPSSINGKLSARADDIILKCLAKDPEDRYQTAKEIAVDLRHLSIQATSGAVSAGTTSVRTGSKVRLWLVAAGAASTAFLVLLFVNLIRSHGAPTRWKHARLLLPATKRRGIGHRWGTALFSEQWPPRPDVRDRGLPCNRCRRPCSE